MRALFFSLCLAACTSASADDEATQVCTARVDVMRRQLGGGSADTRMLAGLPAWAQALHDRITRSADVAERARLLDEAVVKSIDGCYGLADAFREAAAAPSGQRRAAMARLVPEAVSACRCRGVDVESLAVFLQLSPTP
ncbi:MAG: hypothetical protein IPH07_25595 [Deltaproteobacteria bacterium]|nr:hypothetical protein [Deltaproteobacteria bacterium]MBK8240593.1 hypothetical protein [Deltaproteobacteria bacterium]MBK8718133.1 hypothetical protein [Deltaproteobacteria bacterium]MBP7288458.1 hypothetical protein [Nannocystaceae bacterium]